MIVKRITDMEEIVKCIPFEVEIREKGRDSTKVQKMLLFVQSQLENPLFGFWMVYEENEIKGYAVTLINPIPGMEALLLWRLYAKTKEVRELLEDTLREHADEFGIKKVQITTNKNIKALQRKHHFKPVSVNMEMLIWHKQSQL